MTYDVGRGRGRVASGFITTVASGAQRAQGISHRGVFKRAEGAGRLPIRELLGPSLPHVFLQRRIADARQALAAELFVKNMEHEVTFLVRGLR